MTALCGDGEWGRAVKLCPVCKARRRTLLRLVFGGYGSDTICGGCGNSWSETCDAVRTHNRDRVVGCRCVGRRGGEKGETMRYVYKASDLRPGEGLATEELPSSVEAMNQHLHTIAVSWAKSFDASHLGSRAVMVTVKLDATIDYVPVGIAQPTDTSEAPPSSGTQKKKRRMCHE